MEYVAPVIRKQVLFQGHVQGVGFRMTTLQVAEQFDVHGHVRNLSDGRVELECEGRVEIVERFLAAVAQRMDSRIDGIDSRDMEASGIRRGFVIL